MVLWGMGCWIRGRMLGAIVVIVIGAGIGLVDGMFVDFDGCSVVFDGYFVVVGWDSVVFGQGWLFGGVIWDNVAWSLSNSVE